MRNLTKDGLAAVGLMVVLMTSSDCSAGETTSEVPGPGLRGGGTEAGDAGAPPPSQPDTWGGS